MADEQLDENGLRDYLRSLKEQSGMSFEEIARTIGEDARNVKRWLAEKPREPRGLALLKYLEAMGVTLSPPAPPAGTLNEELRQLRATLANGQDPEAATRVERALIELADQVAEMRALVQRDGEA